MTLLTIVLNPHSTFQRSLFVWLGAASGSIGPSVVDLCSRRVEYNVVLDLIPNTEKYVIRSRQGGLIFLEANACLEEDAKDE